MKNSVLKELQKFMSLSENTKISDSSELPNLLMTLASNSEIDELNKYTELLEKSIGTEELGLVINSIKEYINSSFEINEFRIKRRTVRQKTRRRDPRRSRIAKMSWRKNKSRMKRGLKKFHRSSRGKAFHKALGRFVSRNKSRRESEISENDGTELMNLILEMHEFRISINSALTQLLIDYKNFPENYTDLSEEDFEEIFEVICETMKESQEALMSSDSEIIEDTLNELIAEVGSVFIGVDMEFIYDEEE